MPEVIKVSASCFAEFIISSARSRQSKLRPFKFPNTGEGAGRSSYYQRTLKTIKAYLRADRDDNVFLRELAQIEHELGNATKHLQSVKLKRNGMAIEAYRKMYGGRKFVILPNHRLTCNIGGVTVKAQPDLWVEEGGTTVLLKIGVSKKKADFVKIVLFIIRKAALENGHRVNARNVVYLNIQSGEEEYCVDSDRYRNLLENAARDITTVWPTVLSPSRHGSLGAP